MVANTDTLVIFIAEYVKYDFDNSMDLRNKNALGNRQKHQTEYAKKQGLGVCQCRIRKYLCRGCGVTQ